METKLFLYFLDYEKNNLFNYVSLGESGTIEEINQNSIAMIVETPRYNYYDHFSETIKLYKDKSSNKIDNMISFILDIYFQEINQYYCFINYINKYSFDIITFQKDFKEIIKSINIKGKKTYTLDKSNSFGLRNCKKFGLINCDKSYIEGYHFNFPSHCSQGSYYLNMFFPSVNKPPKYSLQKIKKSSLKSLDIRSLTKDHKDFLIGAKMKFKELYYECINEKGTPHEIKSEYSLKLIDIFGKSYDFTPLKNLRYLLARNIKLDLSDEDYDICLGYVIYKLAMKISNYYNAILLAKLIIDLLDELETNLNCRNLNVLKILYWYKKLYLSNTAFIKKLNSIPDLEIKDPIHDFKFCYPKKCAKNTPYNNAVVFMEDFVEKLNDNSYLLEILYLIDSESSSNRIYKNCHVFNLTLLSLEKIKSHLKQLIPEVIVRHKNSKNSESNGSYVFHYGVTRIFENEIFKHANDLDKCLIKEEDKNCKYTIPLIMLLIHEYFCNGKIRLRTKGSESPNYFYNPHNDYEITFHHFEGESGRIFEFYISPKEDVIRFLKYSLTPLPELLNANLWVKENLIDLNNIIADKMKNFDMDTISDQRISRFPEGAKDELLEYAVKDSDYESEVFESLNQEDRKKHYDKKRKAYEKLCE